MAKWAESLIEGVSTLTYICVVYGRLTHNRHWYTPLLLVHMLAIPFLTLVGVVILLINCDVLRSSDFPILISYRFTFEITRSGVALTIYNVVGGLIELYFCSIIGRSYFFMRRVRKKAAAVG